MPHSDPGVFDPHQTSAYSTTKHAALIYDTLVNSDADGRARPQMVEAWERSENRLEYRFRLRPGLRLHDGTGVTARDVIASMRRMFIPDTHNQLFASRVEGMERIDDREFLLRSKEPFPFVELLICGSNNVAGLEGFCERTTSSMGTSRRSDAAFAPDIWGKAKPVTAEVTESGEWGEVDSDSAYAALVRIGAPGAALPQTVSVMFRHSCLRRRRFKDYVAFIGSRGTIHVDGA